MRCPICRAQVDQPPQCRRCRADLSLLFTLEGQREQALAEARECLRAGRWRRSLALAEGVDTLRHDEVSRQLLAVLHLLRRDFDQAWKSYPGSA